jgi:hypothetical protein
MTQVMKGMRMLEVAEHTFVPTASALLSDWGAEVIKIEPVERGRRHSRSDVVRDVGRSCDASALQPKEAKLGIGLVRAGGRRHSVQACRNFRCLPYQQAPKGAQEAQDRRC